MNRFIDMTIPTVFQNFVIFANLGDEVIAINGLCLNGMSDLEAYALFSNSASMVLLEVIKGSCASKSKCWCLLHDVLCSRMDSYI